mgnify:CR=1 FL=1
MYKILDITFPLQKMRTKVPKYRDTTFQRLLIERMQQLRSDHGYSQEEVIEFTHLDISRYESGTSIPNTQSILKLCKLYNITIAEFFAPINYPPKNRKDETERFRLSFCKKATIFVLKERTCPNLLMEELTTIQSKIYEIRGQRVMLDRDLAELYGVTTGNLNKAVKRNIERFPERFMFQLTEQEFLIFQNGTSSWGGTRKRPYAFTEQGVSMLSAVLRSPTAIQVSIRIMDAFVAMRNYIMTTSTMTAELSEIRAKLTLLERADEDNAEAVNDLSEDMRKELDNIYEAIAALSVKVPKARKQPRPIGFKQSK